MKELLYKEFKLAKHPTTFLFLLFATMLLIPSYPYYVSFMYTCLSIFFIFITGRENKDVLFTVLLPLRKRDAVRARCAMIVIMELAQIIVSIPFAILTNRINPNADGNTAGIEANVALFGFVFIMYAIYNIIFLPLFYKTAFKAGVALLAGGIAVMLYIGIMEVLVNAVPVLKSFLDTSDPSMQLKQLPVLAAGVVIYAAVTFAALKKSEANFEKVDL